MFLSARYKSVLFALDILRMKVLIQLLYKRPLELVNPISERLTSVAFFPNIVCSPKNSHAGRWESQEKAGETQLIWNKGNLEIFYSLMNV